MKKELMIITLITLVGGLSANDNANQCQAPEEDVVFFETEPVNNQEELDTKNADSMQNEKDMQEEAQKDPNSYEHENNKEKMEDVENEATMLEEADSN